MAKLCSIKWIVGYIDSRGAIHHTAVKMNDSVDSHRKLWPTIHHGKWRWLPTCPRDINSYGETLDDESLDRIWEIINKYISF